MLKFTIQTAVEIKAIKPAELGRVIVDSTVQEKAIAHPVDSRLLGGERMLEAGVLLVLAEVARQTGRQGACA